MCTCWGGGDFGKVWFQIPSIFFDNLYIKLLLRESFLTSDSISTRSITRCHVFKGTLYPALMMRYAVLRRNPYHTAFNMYLSMFAVAVFYFRCRTAGYKSVFGRSCDRPPRHKFFLFPLCLKANAEMVPKIPSCHYMLLM